VTIYSNVANPAFLNRSLRHLKDEFGTISDVQFATFNFNTKMLPSLPRQISSNGIRAPLCLMNLH
jgi:hypothetical protein